MTLRQDIHKNLIQHPACGQYVPNIIKIIIIINLWPEHIGSNISNQNDDTINLLIIKLYFVFIKNGKSGKTIPFKVIPDKSI